MHYFEVPFTSSLNNDIAIFSISMDIKMASEDPASSQSKNPEAYNVFDKQALAKHTTDTGEILPRKYTGYSHAAKKSL